MAKQVIVLILASVLFAPWSALAAESSCVECHRPQPGALGDPVGQWEGSIHQRHGINCSSCHGGDPTIMSMEAMSLEKGFLGVPAEDDIPSFCGSCHAGVMEDYLLSAHGQALGAGGPHCVTCHGNHAVELASLDIINRDLCTRCHEYGQADEMKSAMAKVDDKISSLQEETRRLRKLGFATEKIKNSIFSVRNQFHQLFHTVNVETVRSQTEEFSQELEKIDQQVAAMHQEVKNRKLLGGGVVVVLGAICILLVLLRKTYKDEEERVHPPGPPSMRP